MESDTVVDRNAIRDVVDRLERDLPAATRRGKALRDRGELALSACYERRTRRLRIELASGVGISIPTAMLQDLVDQPAAMIDTVIVDGGGRTLTWPSLDVDLAVPDLVAGCFGSRAWMSALARRGGSASTPAKRRAARENGKKGGRPRDTLRPRKASSR
jgi:hypothetical protein